MFCLREKVIVIEQNATAEAATELSINQQLLACRQGAINDTID